DAYVPDLQKIHTAGGQLLTLVNDNVSHTRIESGKLDLESLQRDSRTLLDLIIGYSELCQEDAAEQNHASFIADLKKIQNAGTTLLGLLNDSEFLKPLKTGARQPHPAAASDFGASVVTSVRPADEAVVVGPTALVGFLLLVD